MNFSCMLNSIVLAGLIIAFGQCGFAGESAVKADTNTDGGYVLVWADEFNKDGKPDTRNWIYEKGFVRNKELQWYQQDNASCKNGMLVIEGRRERVLNPDYNAKSSSWGKKRKYAEYTSACIKTRGKHQWKFGRFVMRGRIDIRAGLWPAFWTLGSARNWPGCGEIDIMEYYKSILLANACWASKKPYSPIWDNVKIPIKHFTKPDCPDWADKFHVWRMDWDKDFIRLYVDDELLNTVELDKTINKSSDKANPFHEPHYILLNLAIGGNAGGDPSKTKFPSRFEVDYVRVYQKNQRKESVTF